MDAIGRVTGLEVIGALAKVTITAAGGGTERLLLWTDVVGTVVDRETQILWLGMCQDSLVHGGEVLVVTEGRNSARVTAVRLGRASSRTDELSALIPLLL